MTECEIWIDVECKTDEGQTEVVCTVFSRQSFATRPLIGETLSLHPAKGSKHSFNLAMAWGPMPTSQASVEVHEVSHYRAASIEKEAFKISLRCSSLKVQSVGDAESLVAYLTAEHSFEIDPYGPNKLPGGKSCAVR